MQMYLVLSGAEIGDDGQRPIDLAKHELICAFKAFREITRTGHQRVVPVPAMQPRHAVVIAADQQVIAGAAIQIVRATARDQHIVAIMTRKPVVARAALQCIAALAAKQRVVPVATSDPVVSPLSTQGIIAGTAVDDIVSAGTIDRITLHPIVASPRKNRVIAQSAAQIVSTAMSQHHIVAVATHQQIDKIAAIDGIGARAMIILDRIGNNVGLTFRPGLACFVFVWID